MICYVWYIKATVDMTVQHAFINTILGKSKFKYKQIDYNSLVLLNTREKLCDGKSL